LLRDFRIPLVIMIHAVLIAHLKLGLDIGGSMFGRKGQCRKRCRRYVQMFVRSAIMLEDRAARLAQAPEGILPVGEDRRMHAAVNLVY
jgi:hypothetical protein